MKRARIMLMAIAIFGAVGGALAVKASKFSSTIFVYGTTTTACDVVLKSATTTLSTAPHIGTISYFYTTTTTTVPTTLVGTARAYLTTTSL